MRIKKEALKIPMLIVIVILLILIIFLIRTSVPGKGTETTKQETVSEPEEYKLYGETITKAEVDEQYNALPAEVQNNITKQEVADAIATQRLLLKEAEKLNIEVSDEEVEAFIQQNLALASITQEEYQAKLAESGVTEEEYQEQLKQQMLILKLINQSISPDDYKVSDEEVDAFMEENKDTYEAMFEQAPELEEVMREQIRTSLMQQKQQELIKEFIDSLKQ